jgi:hypothetical protein
VQPARNGVYWGPWDSLNAFREFERISGNQSVAAKAKKLGLRRPLTHARFQYITYILVRATGNSLPFSATPHLSSPKKRDLHGGAVEIPKQRRVLETDIPQIRQIPQVR